jgi:hypothetical protein
MQFKEEANFFDVSYLYREKPSVWRGRVVLLAGLHKHETKTAESVPARISKENENMDIETDKMDFGLGKIGKFGGKFRRDVEGNAKRRRRRPTLQAQNLALP